MYDYSKLLGKIIEKFGSRQNFAKSISSTDSSVSKLLNNKQQFTQAIIEKWLPPLGLAYSDVGEYFFCKHS